MNDLNPWLDRREHEEPKTISLVPADNWYAVMWWCDEEDKVVIHFEKVVCFSLLERNGETEIFPVIRYEPLSTELFAATGNRYSPYADEAPLALITSEEKNDEKVVAELREKANERHVREVKNDKEDKRISSEIHKFVGEQKEPADFAKRMQRICKTMRFAWAIISRAKDADDALRIASLSPGELHKIKEIR